MRWRAFDSARRQKRGSGFGQKQLTRTSFSGILFLSRSGGTGRRARLKIVWA